MRSVLIRSINDTFKSTFWSAWLIFSTFNLLARNDMTYALIWLVLTVLFALLFHFIDVADRAGEFPGEEIVWRQYVCGLLALGAVWPIVVLTLVSTSIAHKVKMRKRFRRFVTVTGLNARPLPNDNRCRIMVLKK